MAAPPLLLLQDIRLTISNKPLLEGVELSVGQGERLALVGRNGSGKSTLLKIAAGQIEADGGTRFLQPGTSIRYLPQEPDLSGFDNVLAYVEAGLGPADDHWRAQYLLNELGLQGDEDPSRLSGGEKRRAALARVMAPEPDILLLDEPTNHLDLPAIEWLEQAIGEMRSAMVIISHDRRFLQNLSRATVWIDRGVARRLDRGFGHFEEWRDEVLEQEEIERHKLDRKIVAEEHWVRYGVTARRKRNVRRMGNLADLRSQVREQRHVQGNVKLEAAGAQVSGKLVMEAEKMSKAWGDKVIVKDLSIRILRGDRLGIAGPNGAGKTTLINLLTGKVAPDSGDTRIGSNLEIAALDQQRAQLKDDWTLKEALTGGSSDYVDINGVRKHFAGYMKDFLFTPEQARQPVTKLSGGERGRLALARALSLPSNMLVLDEPTNDLDLETLDLLQEMIADYPGTVLVVSHDRDFLDRVATSTIAPDGNGKWTEYPGGYTDMMSQRGRGFAKTVLSAGSTADKYSDSPGAVTAPAAPPAKKGKMSFKDKHALETIPSQIEDMNARKAALIKEMEDPNLFMHNPARFAKVTEAVGKLDMDLAATEERWLELEMLREELGA
ncbi:MAG: ABC-F family ATP-binding cassette domain-containing protein [Beijerinckiaceae bacterium]|jgi:ABC transport system ATP-binding/permease protein|nr:ABC-F family ATP-binding cassette domain-containing protein [Beijerinckiaceae bacterium]